MKHLRINRDSDGRICHIRFLNGMGTAPSIMWNRDDDYDRPKFRIGWLPWVRLAYYPGLRGPIRYTILGRHREIQAPRWYRRQVGLWIAGLSEERLQAVRDIVCEQQERIRRLEDAAM